MRKLKDLDYVDPIRDWVFCDYKLECSVPDAVIGKRWEWFSGRYVKEATCWKGLSEPKRVYLLGRAFIAGSNDLRRFGGTLPASTNPEYERLVEALRTVIGSDGKWREEEG